MERRHNMSADSAPLLIQQQQDAAAMNNLITGRRRWSRLVTGVKAATEGSWSSLPMTCSHAIPAASCCEQHADRDH
ncbi:unnamed protein product [Gadus morhua 'NCC']